ncbi:hypothetical protein NIES3806_03700 [Microcystis aeruginosa NIES-3806]|uniref:Uncharacterized protein n=1 Tax=Microcystis aeruginosa NIES-3807 TaxID=2517785 RepID=A0AAD3AY98_MICAE|nr:hypothetical protein NIES3806_03700 [Microcystis aeruginosa NIES-3806]GCL57889.1 hypothetical protein NIES3807_10490 [Microcystis aeruginosa NIES-3807]
MIEMVLKEKVKKDHYCKNFPVSYPLSPLVFENYDPTVN